MNFESRGFNSVLTILLQPFKKKNYWTIVDLQCCVGFCCTTKCIHYPHTYIHSFTFFSHIGHYRVLRTRRAPALCSRSLLVIYFIYSGVDMSISTSHFILPPFFLSDHKLEKLYFQSYLCSRYRVIFYTITLNLLYLFGL